MGESGKRKYALITNGTVLVRCIPMTSSMLEKVNPSWPVVEEEDGGIVLPDWVGIIGERAFRDLCPDMGLHLDEWISAMGRGVEYEHFSPSRIVLPFGVRSIRQSAFAYCRGLREIILSDGLEYIGNYAFDGCTGLTSVRIPESVRRLPEHCFAGCTSLREVGLPYSLKVIDQYAFAYCSALEEIRIPDRVERIRSRAFTCCSSLKRVSLPEELHVMEQEAFSHCESLERVVLPEWTDSLGPGCFLECASLRELVLPEAFSSMGSHCLEGCVRLETLRLPARMITLGVEALKRTGLKKLVVESRDPAELLRREQMEPAGMCLELPNGSPQGLSPPFLLAYGRGFAEQVLDGHPFSTARLEEGCQILENVLVDIWDSLPARTLMLDQRRLSLKAARALIAVATDRGLVEITAELLGYIGRNFSGPDPDGGSLELPPLLEEDDDPV